MTNRVIIAGIAHWRIRGTYVIIIAVILLSFFHYSESYYPWLNADSAVNILMAESLILPHDLYFWGQDRGGSLVPLLGHLIYKYMGPGLVMSVSLAHFFFMLCGFLAFCLMVRNDMTRLIMVLFWFLPPWHMHYFLAYNFLALQTSLTIVSVLFAYKSIEEAPGWKNNFYTFLTCITILILCWVSDLAFLSLILLLTVWLKNFKKRQKITTWFFLAGFIIVSALLLHYAKSFATPTPVYLSQILADKNGIMSNLTTLLQSILNILLFRSETMAESIHMWLLLTGLPCLILFRVRQDKRADSKDQWPRTLFFLLNAITILLFLMISQWIFLNGTGRWYFVPVYYSLLVALLLYLDPVMGNMGKFRKSLFIVVAASASISGLYPMYFPKRLPAKIDIVSELKNLGEAGFIGDYWNAYLIACIAPGQIAATPHDRAHIRQAEFPGIVLSKPNLYLVRDQWLEQFPDSIMQFGIELNKSGEEFQLGDCNVCKYSQKN